MSKTTKTSPFAAFPTADVFKDGIEKSLSAVNEISAQSRQNYEATVTAVTAAAKGAQSLGEQAAAYGKKSMEEYAAAARKLAAAKSPQEVVELQAAWTKSALQTYMSEFSKASDLFSASVQSVVAPVQARAVELAEKIKTAA